MGAGHGNFDNLVTVHPFISAFLFNLSFFENFIGFGRGTALVLRVFVVLLGNFCLLFNVYRSLNGFSFSLPWPTINIVPSFELALKNAAKLFMKPSSPHWKSTEASSRSCHDDMQPGTSVPPLILGYSVDLKDVRNCIKNAMGPTIGFQSRVGGQTHFAMCITAK